MARYEGKVVLITVAASGIGAACVRRLWEEGAAAALADSGRNPLPSWGPADHLERRRIGGQAGRQHALCDATADGVAARARSCAFAGEDGCSE